MSPPTTPRGSGPINEMLNRKQLELVTPDSRLAQMQLDQARESLELASEQVAHRPEIALTVAYDASRKAVVAMLEAQGLRAKLPNAHLKRTERPFSSMERGPCGRVWCGAQGS